MIKKNAWKAFQIIILLELIHSSTINIFLGPDFSMISLILTLLTSAMFSNKGGKKLGSN